MSGLLLLAIPAPVFVVVASALTLLVLEVIVVFIFSRLTRSACERGDWEAVLGFAGQFERLPFPFTSLLRRFRPGVHLNMKLFQVHALGQLDREEESMSRLRAAAEDGCVAERLTARLHLCSHLVRQSLLAEAQYELDLADPLLAQVGSDKRRQDLADQFEVLRHDIAARRGQWPENVEGLAVGSRLLFHLARGQFLEGLAYVDGLLRAEGEQALQGGPLLTATVLAAEADRVKEVGERLEALGNLESLGEDARHVAAAVGAWHAARLGQGDQARRIGELLATRPHAGDHGAATASCWLARTHLLLAEPKVALRHAEAAVVRASVPLSEHVSFYWRGRCNEELERHEQAREDYQALLSLDIEAAWTRSAQDRLRALK